jgi:hypothetical protein
MTLSSKTGLSITHQNYTVTKKELQFDLQLPNFKSGEYWSRTDDLLTARENLKAILQ